MDKIKYSIRIQILADRSFFGSGLAELLLLVDEKHSLNKACKKMNMSYSKGWRIVKLAEQKLTFPLLERKTGGAYGGGSEITVEGRKFLGCYLYFKKDMHEYGDILFKKYFKDYIKDGI